MSQPKNLLSIKIYNFVLAFIFINNFINTLPNSQYYFIIQLKLMNHLTTVRLPIGQSFGSRFIKFNSLFRSTKIFYNKKNKIAKKHGLLNTI